MNTNITRRRLMEIAGLPVNEASNLDVQAYISTWVEATKDMHEFDGKRLFTEFIQQNKSEIVQAISTELASSKISGTFAASKEQFAQKIYMNLIDSGVNGPQLLSRAVVIPNTDQGNRTKQFVDGLSQPSMQSYITIKDLPNPKQQSWYVKASDGNTTGVENIAGLVYWGAKEVQEGRDVAVWALDGWQELMIYLVNTQAGTEASSWKYDKGGDSPTHQQDYDKFGLKVKDLFDKKGEQAATELVKAYAKGFGVIADITINEFVEYAKENPRSPESPEPFGADTLAKGNEAVQKFKKDAGLKRRFEKYLANTLEYSDTKEDIIDTYGPGMQEDDFDIDEIVYNIITKKKYREDLGQFFLDFEEETGGVNESIYKQILEIKNTYK